MNPNLQTIKFSNPDLPWQVPSQLDLLEGWPRLSALLSSKITLAVLAILATLVLMLAFHQIVLGAVDQGKLLQQARNLQSEASLRCKALPSSTARDHCLRQPRPMAVAKARL
jgi:hypothetical protein